MVQFDCLFPHGPTTGFETLQISEASNLVLIFCSTQMCDNLPPTLGSYPDLLQLAIGLSSEARGFIALPNVFLALIITALDVLALYPDSK